MPPESDDPSEKCPVDHSTRQAWLDAAKANGTSKPTPHPPPSSAPTAAAILPSHFSLDTSRWETFPTSYPPLKKPKIMRLSTEREISSIPRAVYDHNSLNSAEKAALPPNSERDTGHDRDSGNWIYPSQDMFFAAMRRKGHDAQAEDMEAIVPIHNAVNERAWKEIQDWEKGWGSERCGGPKLVSFAGDSKALTPRARWNGWMGYSEPFDRHDWVIDRCGRKVDYVIDFYKGKETSVGRAGPSFYLDVRPKLNSLEGWKMRIAKTVGW